MGRDGPHIRKLAARGGSGISIKRDWTEVIDVDKAFIQHGLGEVSRFFDQLLKKGSRRSEAPE